MKNLIITFAILLTANFVMAQKPIYTKAKVETVNIYRNSAELQNSASFSVPAGMSEIVIGNVANDIDQKSVQIGVNSDKFSILSTQFTANYADDYGLDKTNPQMKRVLDSIKIVNNLISKNEIEIEANENTIMLLDSSRTMFNGSSSASVAQLSQLADYYTEKRVNTALKIRNLRSQTIDYKKSYSILNSRLETDVQNGAEKVGRGSLIVKILSESAGTVKLTVNYLTNSVMWSPRYNIKGTTISAPLSIELKAAVVQFTGLDWKGVKLSLVNGYPSRYNTAPTVEPLFLRKVVKVEPSITQSLSGKVSGLQIEQNDEQRRDGETRIILRGNRSISGTPQNEIKSNELNVSYDVSVPYNILSNGKEHLIPLYKDQVAVEYNYFAAPNYNKDAFLVAKVKDFAKLNLIAAPATIVFENMYVGETYINPSETDEELQITLGSDRRISVVREDIKDKSGEKFLSSYREKTVTYDLIIRNNKKEAVNIEVKDRIPVSNNDAVKVELLDKSSASIDDEKGFLTWNLKLAPSESKKLRVSYKVRYPKDFVISNF